MRALLAVVVGAVAVVGCSTKRNPDACCTNAVECADVGFDEITPCLGVQVCIDGFCEDPTCTTSADCTDSAAPYCVETTCVAECAGDASCPDPGAPYCGADGACVECLDSDDCVASAPVCDASSSTCRPCVEDAECASGICLGYEGTCASEAEAVFVTSDGADRGDCIAAAPCSTIEFAITKLTGTRRVLRLENLDYVSPSTIVIDRDVYLDAAGTRLSATATGDTIVFSNDANAVIEGVRLVPGTLVVGDSAEVVAYDLELQEGTVKAAALEEFGVGGRLRLLHSMATEDSRVGCYDVSELEVFDDDLYNSKVDTEYCDLSVKRSRFFDIRDVWAINSSQYVNTLVENNFIEHPGEAQGGFLRLQTGNGSPRPVVRFNTMVTDGAGTQVLLHLSPEGDGELTLSSNIIIGGSEFALSLANYVADHNVTDGATGAITGDGNVTAEMADLFVDPEGGDFRLSSTSPARGAGDPAQDPGVDLDGNPRPLPAGSAPDIGAFEVE